MPSNSRDRLGSIKSFSELVAYLRDELDWPITDHSFEDLTFDYEPDELGLDEATAAKVQEIKRLRPLSTSQPWGVFFVAFEPKKLPVVALRRILSAVALKRRATANASDRVAWEVDDLLFISAFGDSHERQISFAHFSHADAPGALATLKVLGWDSRDTALHLDEVADALTSHLSWPVDEADTGAWRSNWQSAFTVRHGEVVRTADELSSKLAVLARRVYDRIAAVLEVESENGPLTKLMAAFKKTLVHDLTPSDFADMYAQTVSYGLLAEKITREATAGGGLAAELPASSPFVGELIDTFMSRGSETDGHAMGAYEFDEIGFADVAELLDDANMDAVLADFGDRNPREDPVIHFYEHFLSAYDPQRRADRGVFYTPRSVVGYIVRSVDERLKSQFGLEDGLADTSTWRQVVKRNPNLKVPSNLDLDEPFVQILDPATGTGTFLVEVIDVVHRTMLAKWSANGQGSETTALWNQYVEESLLPRLVGYELMMAPYVIAHLKLGLKLLETGYRFGSSGRIGVYLTNALEPPHDRQDQLDIGLPALAHEAEAVSEVKASRMFTVVIGNPPYAGHSHNNSIHWIVDLVRDYSRDDPTLCGPGQGKWLQDDYVKFMRLSQFILGRTGAGVFSMITNHRYLTNRTFREMRRKWAESFATIEILDLHGNSVVAEHSPVPRDENVFDIEQGVAIHVAVADGRSATEVQWAELWGRRETDTEDGKYDFLDSHTVVSTVFRDVELASPLYIYSLDAHDSLASAEEWECLTRIERLMPGALGPNGKPPSGLATMHDRLALGFTPQEVESNVDRLLATASRDEALASFGGLCNPGQWDYDRATSRLRAMDWQGLVCPIYFAPFDIRYTVYDNAVAVHLRRRLSDHLFCKENLALVIGEAGQEISGGEWDAVSCVDGLLQLNYFRRNGSPTIPLYLYEESLLGDGKRPNLDSRELAPLRTLFRGEAESEHGLPAGVSPEDLMNYMYAVLHSPSYRDRYAGYLRTSFPRMPWPTTTRLFRDLAALGHELVSAQLLKTDEPAAAIETVGASLRVEKVVHDGETVYIDTAKTAGFTPVTLEVWDFHVGGYRVCEKWLKDRKDRLLTATDVVHYKRIVLAVERILTLMSEVDETIASAGSWGDAFAVTDMDTNSLAAEDPVSYRP